MERVHQAGDRHRLVEGTPRRVRTRATRAWKNVQQTASKLPAIRARARCAGAKHPVREAFASVGKRAETRSAAAASPQALSRQCSCGCEG